MCILAIFASSEIFLDISCWYRDWLQDNDPITPRGPGHEGFYVWQWANEVEVRRTARLARMTMSRVDKRVGNVKNQGAALAELVAV